MISRDCEGSERMISREGDLITDRSVDPEMDLMVQ